MEGYEVHSSDPIGPATSSPPSSPPVRRPGQRARAGRGTLIPSSIPTSVPKMPASMGRPSSQTRNYECDRDAGPSTRPTGGKRKVDTREGARKRALSASSGASVEAIGEDEWRRKDDKGKGKSKADSSAKGRSAQHTTHTSRTANGETRGKKKPPEEAEGPLGQRKSAAYLRFHASLAGSPGPSTPKAYGQGRSSQNHLPPHLRSDEVDSPDPLDSLPTEGDDTPRAGPVLSPRSTNLDVGRRGDSSRKDGAVTKKRLPKAMAAHFLKSGDDTPRAASRYDERYGNRSPSPSPVTNKAKRSSKRGRSPSPQPTEPPIAEGKKTVKTANGKAPPAKYPPTPSPVECASSTPGGPNGDAFFAEMEKARREEDERLVEEAAERLRKSVAEVFEGPKINSSKKKAYKAEAEQWRDRDEEEFRAMQKMREEKQRSIADDFFKDAPKEAEAARHRRSLEARSRAIVETGHFAPKVKELDEDELYCAAFKDMHNLCPHCSDPLPKNPTADLVSLQKRYAPSRSLSLRQTLNFCTMHRAETSIIPLGQREGYPAEIDFERVDRRLEQGWIFSRLKRVAAKPHLSKFYRRSAREIGTMGLSAWKDQAHQSKVLASAQPGYYGDLGKEIMICHFQNLTRWGHLKLDDATAPLPETDFIATVLVPEAAVLLIMEDDGWASDISKGEEWDVARNQAMERLKKSGAYGYWRFRGDGEEGRRILDRLEKASGAKHHRLDAARDAVEAEIARKIKAERAAITRNARYDNPDAIFVASSDTEVPDASDWSGDEFWADEGAVAAVAEAAERRVRSPTIHHIDSSDVDENATPKATVKAAKAVKPAARSPLTACKVESKRPPRLAHKSSSSGIEDDWDEVHSGQAVVALEDVVRSRRRR